MKLSILSVALVAKAIEAAPQKITAISNVGASTSDVYPPAGSKPCTDTW